MKEGKRWRNTNSNSGWKKEILIQGVGKKRQKKQIQRKKGEINNNSVRRKEKERQKGKRKF